MDWKTTATKAAHAFAKNVNAWLGQATIKSSKVNGPNAELPPGCLASAVDLKQAITRELQSGGVDAAVAKALAKELADAWLAWSSKFQVSMPGAFPSLAAVPARTAPATTSKTKSVPLRQGKSVGESRLGKGELTTHLINGIKTCPQGDTEQAKAAMGKLADWLAGSFSDWKQLASISTLKASGPIPTFAPPYVPVGPVVGGTVSPLRPGLFNGPRFGRPPNFG